MSKLWLIVRHEYRRHVLKPGFAISTLSVPLAVLIAVVVSLLLRASGIERESPGSPMLGQLLPALSGFTCVILVFVSSGYLMGAVADEKTNRTIEILVTAVSPSRLMTAKLLAILAITLTQLAAWIVLVGLIGLLGGSILGVTWLQGIRVDPTAMLIVLAVLLPSYALVAALMTAAGAIMEGGHSAQHITTAVLTFYLMPSMLIVSMLRSPNQPLMVVLSLLPFAAPITLPLRAAFTQLPFWQVGASVAIQVLCALGAVWLAGRALRLGMLRYGRRLRWRELVGRSAEEPGPQSRPSAQHQDAWQVERTEQRARGTRRNKTWLIMCHELVTTVTKPVFVLACVGIPLLVLAQLGAMVYSGHTTPADVDAQTALLEDKEGLMRLVPTLVMLLLYGMILMASGLVLHSVSEEKKTRVMEILLLSVSPRQMLTGKTTALGVAGLIQVLVWTAMGALFFALGGRTFYVPKGVTLSPSVLGWFLVFTLLGYAVYACLYAGVGALLPDMRQSRQASLLIALPAFIGFQIGLLTTDNPHGALALGASLFPLTAPFVMVRRLVVGGTPWWQPPVAAGVMILSIPLIVRAVARMFHAQNLLSGQPFSIKRYFCALLGACRSEQM
jgi:ABC-type Na+ efflux pump permease subunit